MFLQQLINGLTIGSTYALVAIGFSMVFGDDQTDQLCQWFAVHAGSLSVPYALPSDW